jgi:hypothetical protein
MKWWICELCIDVNFRKIRGRYVRETAGSVPWRVLFTVQVAGPEERDCRARERE